MEAGDGGSESLELGLATWYVSWCLDPVHETLFVILDSRSPELALSHAAISVSHIYFSVSWHKVLDILSILVLFLLFGLLLAFAGHIVGEFNRGLRLMTTLFALVIAVLEVLIGLFRDCLIILVVIETLVRHVVVSWRVFHRAVD